MCRRHLAIITLLLVLLGASSTLLRAGEPRLLIAADCGLRPEAGYDNGPALARLPELLKAASEAGDSVILRFAPGCYHIEAKSLPLEEVFISNHDHVAERPVALLLEDLHRVSIEGEGVTLLLHGRALPVVVSHCSDLTLSGFCIDAVDPALSQLEILSVEENRVTAQLPEETRYRIEGNRLIVEGEGFDNPIASTMPFGADGHMKWGRADIAFDPEEIEQLDERTVVLTGWAEMPHLAAGDRYLLRSWSRPAPGITISDSSRVRLLGVTVHYAEGMGLVAQDSEDLTLEHFAVKRPEGSPRIFTTQADATHFSNCRGFIRSTGGLYENMADDAINVHGVYLRIDSLLSDRSLLATFAHPQAFGLTWGEEGDTVRLVDRQTLMPLHTGVIARIETIDETHKRIELTAALPADLPERMALENYSAMPTVFFADNVVRDNRARGALFSTWRKVICRDNLFDHTHGSAILLSGDANGWYESGPCEDVLIEGNRFIDPLTAQYQFTNAIISILPVLERQEDDAYYHGRVVIRDNDFDTFPSPLLYALSVRELEFQGNRVRINDHYRPLFPSTESRFVRVGELHAEGL